MGLNNRYKNIKARIIAYSLLGSLTVNCLLTDFKRNYVDVPGSKIDFIREINLEDLKQLIFSSSFLNEEEKKYLYNEDFLNDILPFINEGILRKLKYQNHLTDMSIDNYTIDDYGSNYLGYYTTGNPNTLYIRNYDDFKNHKDTLAHEFIHLCQELGCYNLITEACAEIISREYFEDADIDVYTSQVKLVKILMEIIGAEPIWIYNFTGDFQPIEDAVKPYFSSEDYYEFLSCLSFESNDDKNNLVKFERLDELLSILYKNMYDDDIKNNEVISVIKDSSAILTRYYFNPRLINQENSFYYRRTDVEYGQIDYETAMERNLFYACAIKHEPVTYEEAMDELANGTHNLRRDIDFKANDIILYRSIVGSNETIITAKIDGVMYEEANVDDLVKQGIIKVDYYKIYFQVLNAQEYINKECIEGAEIHEIYYSKDLTLHEDYIEGYIPKIHYLEPINKIGYSRVLKKTNN